MAAVVVIGSYNRDLIFATDALPAPGQTRLGRFASAHGGKGFNQAVAACRLAVPTLFIGALGRDSYAEDARAFARAEGLACRWQEADAATGVACVLIDPAGNNQIVVAPGANEALDPGHVAAGGAELAAARVVLVQLECNLKAVKRALEIARGAAVTTILNPAPLREDLRAELVALADVITPNESEFVHLLERLAGVRLPPGWDDGDDARLHAWCRRTGIGTVVITLGERGCFVSHAAQSRVHAGEHWERIPASRVVAVDSTGAGDAFNGALAAGLVHCDGDFGSAVRLAVRAAGLSVTRPGAAPSMPRRHELGLTVEK